MDVEKVTVKDVRLGAKVSFYPAECPLDSARPEKDRGCPVRLTGEIVYVNTSHRYFTVEAALPRGKYRESFKF